MSEYVKPLPKPSVTSRPFWDAARRHELQLQRCAACGKFMYYPRKSSFQDDIAWTLWRAGELGK